MPENRILASDLPTHELADAVEKLRPEFVSTYPSTIRNVAVAMHRRGTTWRGLKLLHLTSEVLDGGTRSLLAKVFPAARLVETYTSTEAGLIAYSCPAEPHRLHVAEDGVILEIVDAAGRPTDGVGEVVVTDLTDRATPLIRYRGLGDFGRWEPSACPCGIPRRSIRSLEGRLADSVLLATGESLSPYALVDAIEELPGIYQFQVIQESFIRFAVRVVRDPSAGLGEGETGRSIALAVAALVPGADCRAEFVRAILPETGRHKVPLVVSRLGAPGRPIASPERT